MSQAKLAVTGSTGEVGGRVAARLAKLGVEQRLVVRDPERAPMLPAPPRLMTKAVPALRKCGLNTDGRPIAKKLGQVTYIWVLFR